MASGNSRVQRWQSNDFYKILDLDPSASPDAVKRGFRQIALQCHPDKVNDSAREAATRRFQLIAEAYEVLSNPVSRQEYDVICGREAPYDLADRAAGGVRSSGVNPQKSKSSTTFNPPNFAGQAAPPRHGPSQGSAKNGPKRNDEDYPTPGARETELRCDGCDRRCQHNRLRKCPQCPARICYHCEICAACIPFDIQNESSESRQAKQRPQPRCRPRNDSSWMANTYKDHADSSRPPTGAEVWRRTAGADGRSEIWRRCDAPDPKDVDQEPEPCKSMRACEPGQASRFQPTSRVQTEGAGDFDQELLGILIAMGFKERDARQALNQNATTASAISWLMSKGTGLYSVLERAGTGFYDAAVERIPPGSSGYYEDAFQSATDGIYGAAAGLYESMDKVKEQVRHWTSSSNVGGNAQTFASVAAEGSQSGAATVDVKAALLALGFSPAKASGAASRCSSVEAAVEWIEKHPHLAAC